MRDRSYSRSQSRDSIRKKLEDISDQLTNKEESNVKLIELMKTLSDIGEKLPESSNSGKVVTNNSHFVEVISQPIETFNIEVQKTTSKLTQERQKHWLDDCGFNSTAKIMELISIN